MKNKERRSTERFHAPLMGTATINTEQEETTVEVQVKDISAYNAYLIAHFCPRVGDDVFLRLEWLSKDEQPEAVFEGLARVLRVEQVSDEEYGFAVRFDQIPGLSDDPADHAD